MKPKNTPTVSGTLKVSWQVTLPEETKYTQVMCEDPAVELALEGISGGRQVYLWGLDREPATVIYEAYEEDVEIDEDDR